MTMCRFILFYYLVLIVGCQTHQLRNDLQTDMLFPDGKYQQLVQVNIFANAEMENKSYNFDAVLNKSGNKLFLYSYSVFGATLFKLNDDGQSEPEFISSIDEISKNKDFFMKIYPLLKATLNLKAKNYQTELSVLEKKLACQISIEQISENTIPKWIIFSDQKHFQLKVINQNFTLDTSHR